MSNTCHIGRYPDGTYFCGECAHSWKYYNRYLWWPIGFYVGIKKWMREICGPIEFSHWGWQIGSDGPSRPVFGHTFEIYVLGFCFQVRFGSYNYKSKVRYNEEHQQWELNI